MDRSPRLEPVLQALIKKKNWLPKDNTGSQPTHESQFLNSLVKVGIILKQVANAQEVHESLKRFAEFLRIRKEKLTPRQPANSSNARELVKSKLPA